MRFAESDVFGKVLAMARARARLTVEQVAERSGVAVETLREIESGSSSDFFNALDKAVKACGNEMSVYVRTEVETGDARARRKHLHDLITRLLFETQPGDNLVWRAAMQNSCSYVMLGFLGAARELLRSLLLLDAQGHSFYPLPLIVRQIWEYTATASWIGEEPDTRVGRLAQDTNYYVQQRAREDGRTEQYDSLVEMWQEHGLPMEDFARRLPSFEQRLGGFFTDWYTRYRYFSQYTHPSMFVVESAFKRDDLAITFQVEVLGETQWIAFGALLVWGLANQLELGQTPSAGNSRSGLGFKCNIEEFAALGYAIEQHTKDDPGDEIAMTEAHDA